MAKPTRTFTGEEGQPSTGSAGPEAIKTDIDSALKMFDPNATLPSGEPGGIDEENIRSGAASDRVIGSRTVDQDLAPTGSTGTLTQLLSWFANRIKAITGKSNWYDTPDYNMPGLLQEAKNYTDLKAVGGVRLYDAAWFTDNPFQTNSTTYVELADLELFVTVETTSHILVQVSIAKASVDRASTPTGTEGEYQFSLRLNREDGVNISDVGVLYEAGASTGQAVGAMFQWCFRNIPPGIHRFVPVVRVTHSDAWLTIWSHKQNEITALVVPVPPSP